MNIFEVIRRDHEKQRSLVKALVETSGDSASRKLFFNELKEELEAHAAAEERHFYVPIMKADATLQQSRHAIHEHHQLDKMIEKLEQTEMSSPAWLQYMNQLKDKLLHHLEEEEQKIFQQAGKVLESSEKNHLAKAFDKEKESLITA
ncbi:hemerythrin domain-containing protein [Aliikangiella maris]|uniref:Hemerythrin domain-containing protein n=2 Tax=Aliikangiella maris TaxID=3162458 RepID=A0ABV3MQV0_9GAMM